MRPILMLLLSLLLLTACSPRQMYGNYQLRQTAERSAKDADAMALVTVGQKAPSYEAAGDIYTDYEVTVIHGRNVEAGEKLTIRRHGGSVGNRMVIVDYVYYFPEEGGQAFLLLRRAGEKYEIIDAMNLQGGQPASNRPEHQVYLQYLKSLN